VGGGGTIVEWSLAKLKVQEDHCAVAQLSQFLGGTVEFYNLHKYDLILKVIFMLYKSSSLLFSILCYVYRLFDLVFKFFSIFPCKF